MGAMLKDVMNYDDDDFRSSMEGSLLSDSAATNRYSSSSRSLLSGAYDLDEIMMDVEVETTISYASDVSGRMMHSGSVARSSRRRKTRVGEGSNCSLHQGRPPDCRSAQTHRASSGFFMLFTKTRRGEIFRWLSYAKQMLGTKLVAFVIIVAMSVFLAVAIGLVLLGFNHHYGSSDGVYLSDERQVRRKLAHFINNSRPWPVSVRDEESNFELLPHPAKDDVTLSVPRFFLTTQPDGGTMDTLGKGKLLTRRVADMIGRTTVEKSRDPSVRTIFVGIASYRDWRCRYTVEGAFARARHPERIRIGVVDQLEQGGHDASCDVPIVACETNPDQALCRYRGQIDVYEMESALSVGPVFSRHIVNRLYRGEYYALQIDSHVTFRKDWDVELVQQHDNTRNEMAVISTYLENANGNIDDLTGQTLKESRQSICNAVFEGAGRQRRLRHAMGQQPEALSAIQGSPQLQPYWSAEFSFSRGHFVLTVPYDPNLPMTQKDDEEISMAIRAFTHGYDFYTPERSVCFENAASERNTRMSFLEHGRYEYEGYEQSSLERLYGMIGLEPGTSPSDWSEDTNEMFATGRVRELSKFFSIFGIHVRERVVESKLCDFVVSGRMHNIFQEHLRRNGMGIDYSQIHFRFHELQHNHENG